MVIPLRKQAPDERGPRGHGELRWSATWDSRTLTVAEARRATHDFLVRVRDSGPRDIPDRFLQDAQLVVSELVTNVIRHAPGPCGMLLEMSADGTWLRIGVFDTSGALPQVKPRDGARVGGHGLEITQALSARLTVTPHGTGKRISAELRVP
ncbi:ATP-binding protein [Streptomyces sp. NPDC085946]|uniref:ATP-binding protein n=1 Tax=Streptomyces sp. NPDC085946 TaxID=3365744 RepID=UPI0037D20027